MGKKREKKSMKIYSAPINNRSIEKNNKILFSFSMCVVVFIVPQENWFSIEWKTEIGFVCVCVVFFIWGESKTCSWVHQYLCTNKFFVKDSTKWYMYNENIYKKFHCYSYIEILDLGLSFGLRSIMNIDFIPSLCVHLIIEKNPEK